MECCATQVYDSDLAAMFDPKKKKPFCNAFTGMYVNVFKLLEYILVIAYSGTDKGILEFPTHSSQIIHTKYFS